MAMPRRAFLCSASAAGLLADPALALQAHPHASPVGLWVGGGPVPGGYASVDLTLAGEPSALAGSMSGFRFGLSNTPVAGAASDGRLALTFSGRRGAGGLDGRLAHDAIRGAISVGEERVDVALVPSEPHRSEEYETLLGTYRADNGDLFGVGRLVFSPKIILTNFTTGEMRTLYPRRGGGYFFGTSYAVAAPMAAQVEIDRGDDRVSGLTITTPGGRTQLRRLADRTEEVEIRADDGLVLYGTLRTPPGEGPFPVVVFSHGSAPSRHSFVHLQYFLPAFGVATLAWDKRGAAEMNDGRTGGERIKVFDQANFERLARDIVSVVDFAKAHPRVRPDRIGVIGISQSGWTVPIAATMSPDIATTILLSGPAASWEHENTFSQLTQEGSGNAPQSLAEIEAVVAAAPPGGFDPLPYIRRMTRPALWLSGAIDQSQPARLSHTNLLALKAAGQANIETVLYPRGQHALWEVVDRGFNAETPLIQRFVPEFFPYVRRWLETHLL